MSTRVDTVKTNNTKVTMETSRWWNASTISDGAVQFPLEILQQVFIFLVDLHYGNRYSGRPGWIAITYVCRYWRSAALGLRELWSSIIIPGISFSWSQVMVERSSPFPMQIDMGIHSFGEGIAPVPASDLLLHASTRIRTLCLYGNSENVLKVLNHLRSPSALESLTLWITILEGPFDLAEVLCERDVPHLHRLTFKSHVRIGTPLWLLANITHFTASTNISVDELLRTLQEMPLLEVLHVLLVGPWNDTSAGPAPEHVTPPLLRAALPRLSLLSFRELSRGLCTKSFELLSSHIDPPPTLRRRLIWELSDVSGGYKWKKMLTAMPAFVPGDSAQGIDDGGLRTAQMGGYQCGWLEVWSRTYSGGASTATREDALFLLHVEWKVYSPFQTDFPNPYFLFASTCFRLFAAKIEDLTIAPGIESEVALASMSAPHPLFTIEKWKGFLADLASVRTLRLRDGDLACSFLLRALSTGTSADPLLPRLQKIIVINSAVYSASHAFSDGVNEVGAETDCSVKGDKFMQLNVPVGVELVEVVSGRSGLEVVLAGCEVDEEALNALRKQARVYIGHKRVYV